MAKKKKNDHADIVPVPLDLPLLRPHLGACRRRHQGSHRNHSPDPGGADRDGGPARGARLRPDRPGPDPGNGMRNPVPNLSGEGVPAQCPGPLFQLPDPDVERKAP